MPPKICCDVLSSDPIIRHLGELWQYQAFHSTTENTISLAQLS
jgi:hypothetical protein